MIGALYQRAERTFLATCEGIGSGQLRITTPDGAHHDFGSGAPSADMHIHDWSVVTAMAARGDVGLGDTYVAGLWDTSSVRNLATVGLLNLDQFSAFANAGFLSNARLRLVDRIVRANSRTGSARNVRAHYDVGNEFYQQWLDPSMTYSSAIYADDDDDLGRAQARKHDRILSRLGGGERLLDIGCGWGAFAEHAAETGRQVTGLTISPSQKGYADARLDGRGEIRLQDYRDVTGKFDNIVSIEMVEAVGERYWPEYFRIVSDRLADGGRAVIQAITVRDSYFDIYRRGSDFVRHRVFPGGMLLSDAVIAAQARRAGLVVRDRFSFGQDYAKTCDAWRAGLDQRAARIAALGYGDGFLRSWRYYLETCAASFATAQTDVVQVELAHAT